MAKQSTSTTFLSWVPYRNLLAYHIAQGLSLKAARKVTRNQVALAFGDDGVRFSWKRPSDEDLKRAKAWTITPAIEGLTRGLGASRPQGRAHLDRLILAYQRSGYAPEIALREVHLDYESIDNVPPLSQGEVESYAGLFWDFLSETGASHQHLYLETCWPGTEELAIYRGERSLAEVRSSCLVLRSLSRPDYGGEVVVQVNDVMQKLIRQIREDIQSLEGSGAKLLKDKTMLLARLSLTQDRLRRSQSVDTSDEDQLLGLDELLGEVERGRERRAAHDAGIPWSDPESLIRSNDVA